MRTIIIDDEPKAIDLIKSYLAHYENIDLIQSFRNGISALEFINSNKVDLIFLDINMPHLSGIQLAKAINGSGEIIFTTAYSEFAAESYNLDAVDYLLKPISFERFALAISKLKRYSENNISDKKPIMIKSGKETARIKVDEILYLEKEGNYITYFLHSHKTISRQSIAQSLQSLPDYFIQVHKSYIINTKQIDSFQKNYITIKGKNIPLGQLFRKGFLKKIEESNT